MDHDLLIRMLLDAISLDDTTMLETVAIRAGTYSALRLIAEAAGVDFGVLEERLGEI